MSLWQAQRSAEIQRVFYIRVKHRNVPVNDDTIVSCAMAIGMNEVKMETKIEFGEDMLEEHV